MTNWLIHRFIKDYKQVKDDQVRARYGTLSSFLGIGINLCLFIVKMILGIITGSIAITSDAINNLSDAANCIVTLFGYKMAAKPADRDHPFGHGRVEYISSLFMAVVILLLGIELFKAGIDKILHPTSIQVNGVILTILTLTILVKLWMYFFNKKIGKLTNNRVLLATATDSINDVFATSATLIAAVSSLFFSYPLDGIMGLFVSLFILYSGFDLVRSTVNELIGQPADEELVSKIHHLLVEDPRILGVHDMIIHNYGPGKILGTAHVEVDAKLDFLVAHDLVDQIESKIEKELHMIMTLHMDPVICDNVIVDDYRQQLEKIINEINDQLHFHDFRVVMGPTHTNIIFDLVIPYEMEIDTDDLKRQIDEKLYNPEKRVYTVIKFERGYC